jgi:anti-anti-sigma factor
LAQKCHGAEVGLWDPKNYLTFMIPKSFHKRLSISMQSSNSSCQTWAQPYDAAFEAFNKGWKLKLSLETRNCGDVVIVYCEGRIVYRDEASALSQMVGEFLQYGGRVVLDLSGVSSIDSAGIGELILLHTRAQSQKAEMKYASPRPMVREVLGLTNVDSVLEIHASVCDALAAFQPAQECAEC